MPNRIVLAVFFVFLVLFFYIFILAKEARSEVTLNVLINSKTIELLENNTVEFRAGIATPKTKPKEAVAIIASVEENPWWHPTEPTRTAYFKKYGTSLPQSIPPGHPKNAMGAVKFNLRFISGNMNSAVKIHGTNQPEFIGQAVSRGCFRVKNDDALLLAKIIKEKIKRGEQVLVKFIHK